MRTLTRTITARTITAGALFAAGILGTTAAVPTAAQAQDYNNFRYYKCESSNRALNRCYVRTRGQVQLVQRLSSRNCSYQRDWGYDRRHIWVDNGCRAVFAVPRGRRFSNGNNGQWGNNGNWGNNGTWNGNGNNGTWGNNGNWGNNGPVYEGDQWRRNRRWAGNRFQRYVNCQSFNNAYAFCRVFVRNDVRLVQQISSDGCRQGHTWGYRQDGIWVRNGCRATFEVR